MFPFIVVEAAEAATVLKMSRMDVSELVAVVTMHPAVAVEVALAVFVTVRVAEPVPPPTVKLPDNSVELADAFLIVSPERSRREEALKVPTTVDEASDKKPPVSVERPVTLKAATAVDEACDTKPAVSVERPVTSSVPPVETLVLIVVAAWAIPALMKITASERTIVRVVLPRLFTYSVMRFIAIDKYVKRIIRRERLLRATILLRQQSGGHFGDAVDNYPPVPQRHNVTNRN